ncbi:alpha/beta hydrolase [Mesorhizobium sp. LSJC255A00]|uniref:alpha/beta fold hydrolase n=1 Tax=Mesorhizobium sp. LSJC255A00 TaxID=1287313 RepID=UPI00041E8898|nr:alpha/beta hydrolase [Mesorhizobium sp. LSJC255A00]
MGCFGSALDAVTGFFRTKQSAPSLVEHRNNSASAALVLVHGFTGDTTTWSDFIPLFLSDDLNTNWDLFSLGYPTSLRIDIPNVWSADPGIDILSIGLTTSLKLAPLANYRLVAIAAHSMGGLLLQRAVCDDSTLRARLSHVFLFGTPSAGITKARLLARLKRQFRDMSPSGAFISKLRKDWGALFGSGSSFAFRAVAGDRDEFVNGESSLGPFPAGDRRVVPGNHLQIVRPTSKKEQSYSIVAGALSGREIAQTDVDGAEVALELRNFHAAVQTLLPNAAKLDDNAVVTLALALEGLKRGNEALQILNAHFGSRKPASEVMAALAGRLKRQWLVGGLADDFDRAKTLYSGALQLAESAGDNEQAYYSAINVAFLDLMRLPPGSDMSASVKEMAIRALDYCQMSPEKQWKSATMGEAYLLLADLDRAEESYRDARQRAKSPRELESMASQAVRVADRIFGDVGAKRIGAVFGYSPK